MNAVAELAEAPKQHPVWVQAIEKAKPRFIKQADKHGAVDWDTEAAFIRQSFQASADLRNCTPISITNAIELMGVIGISISPMDKLAFLQARNVKISAKDVEPEVWEKQAELKIQFTGLIKIVTDSGAAHYMRADVVHEHDNFVYNGPTEKPDFKVTKPFDLKARGPVVGAFAEAKCADGITYCEILTMEDINNIKGASKTGSYGPWKDFPNEMRKKAAIRRLYKTIPKRNERVAAASVLSAENDGFEMGQSPEDATPPEPSFTPELKEQFDSALAEDNAALIWHWERSLPTSLWADLCGSGEKGQITKIRNLVRELSKKGIEEFQAVVIEMAQFKEADDTASAGDMLSDYPDMLPTLLEQVSDAELSAWIEGLES